MSLRYLNPAAHWTKFGSTDEGKKRTQSSVTEKYGKSPAGKGAAARRRLREGAT